MCGWLIGLEVNLCRGMDGSHTGGCVGERTGKGEQGTEEKSRVEGERVDVQAKKQVQRDRERDLGRTWTLPLPLLFLSHAAQLDNYLLTEVILHKVIMGREIE